MLFRLSIALLLAGIAIIAVHRDTVTLREPKTPQQRAMLNLGCTATTILRSKLPLTTRDLARMKALIGNEGSLAAESEDPYLKQVFRTITRAAEDGRTLSDLVALCRSQRLPVDDYEPAEVGFGSGPKDLVLARGASEGIKWTFGVRPKRDGYCTVFHDDEGGTTSGCDVFGIVASFPIVAERVSASKQLDATHSRSIHFIFGSVQAAARAVVLRFSDGATLRPVLIQQSVSGRRYFVIHIDRTAPDAVAIALDASGAEIGKIPIPAQPSAGSP